jgi:glycosyltransferase involved in cell wall biosynthesis
LLRLAGPVPRGELARRLPKAAVLAAPCRVAEDGNQDGLPTVILEAMASGVPVVATRVTGIPEAVEEGRTGRLLAPGHPEALAEALEELLTNPGLRRTMGAAGRKRAEELFDQRRNVALLASLLSGDELSVEEVSEIAG